MKDVRKTPAREHHINTSQLVRAAEEGAVIAIERRGEPVAELRPITTPQGMPDHQRDHIFDSMRDIWARMPAVSDSTKILEEDRER